MKTRIRGLRAVALALACAVASGAPLTAQTSNWFTYNGNYEAHRFTPLAQITTGNVASLREVCTFDSHEVISMESGPVVVDGVLYLTTDTSTFAIDARTCAQKWRHSRPAPDRFLRVNRGVAYLDGRIFRGGGDAHVYAIDASTGTTAWDVSIGDAAKGESVPMAPLAWNGLVFVGNAGGDAPGVVGRVNALDARTGRVVWTFKTIPDTGAARRGWTNAEKVPPTGGGIWTSLAFDPVREVLFVPAGNPAPDFYPSVRPGPNLYTNSVIELDAKTGRFLGYVQPVKDDYHDWDISSAPSVITTRGGRTMLTLAGKDGFLHGISRDGNSLRIRFSVPTTTRSNVDAPLSAARSTHFCPGTQGGTEWNGTAFNPALNLVYAGAVDWCSTIRQVPPDSVRYPLAPDFTGNLGGGFGALDDTTRWQGWVTAVDPDRGRVQWKYRTVAPVQSAIVTTASGLLFVGDMRGNLLALDARSGKRLWTAKAGPAIGGGVVSYDVLGRQYVAAVNGQISPIWPVEKSATARVTIYGLP